MTKSKFSIRKRLNSFKYAFNGLKIVLKEEHNSRIQLFFAFCVLMAGWFFQISTYDWIAIIFAIGFIIALETINTALENISDFVSPEKHETIKKIKDLSAAAVLVGSISAAIIGFIVFIPKFLELFSK